MNAYAPATNRPIGPGTPLPGHVDAAVVSQFRPIGPGAPARAGIPSGPRERPVIGPGAPVISRADVHPTREYHPIGPGAPALTRLPGRSVVLPGQVLPDSPTPVAQLPS
jgi:hypothetical protein